MELKNKYGHKICCPENGANEKFNYLKLNWSSPWLNIFVIQITL